MWGPASFWPRSSIEDFLTTPGISIYQKDNIKYLSEC